MNPLDDFRKQFLGEWSMADEAVYPRETVMWLYEQGHINRDEVERLLCLRYTTRRGREMVTDHHDDVVDVVDILPRINHILC
jgi:hypothetical protein